MVRRTPRRWLPALLLLAADAFALTADVRVEGLSGPLLDNARAALSLLRIGGSPGLSEEAIRRLFAKGEEEIRAALEPFGHYRPVIRGELRPPDAPEAPWTARFRVEPGPPVRVEGLEVAVTGPADEEARRRLAERLALRRGAVFVHPDYERAKQEWLRAARAEGFLDARLERHRVVVDPAADAARVTLALDTGPRYRFGAVDFGQGPFAEAYLRRFVPFAEGEPFAPEQVDELRRLLTASGHFEQVDVERLPPTAEAPDQVPLQVELRPAKPNRYRVQLGYGTDTGFGAQVDWTRRYLGARGHSFRANAVVVEEQRKLVTDFQYDIPLHPPTRARLELLLRHQSKDLTFEDLELDEGGETRIADNVIGVQHRRTRTLRPGLPVVETLGVHYLSESYDIFQVLFGNLPGGSQDAIEAAIGAEGAAALAPSFEVLMPEAVWAYRRADDRLLPRDADFLQIELRGAWDGAGSNVSFAQARLRGVSIRPLADDRLILRFDLGATRAETKEVLGATLNQLPEYLEFRTGGARTVRGYGYEELIPEQSITGGKHLVVGSVEYEKRLFGDWSAAVFLDAGDAFNEYDALELKRGAGFGARWRSPVGLVRADLAFPLDESDDTFQFYFTIGPEF